MLRKSTFNFLKEVKKNNNRDWFSSHKDLYEQAKSDAVQFLDQILKKSVRFEPLLKGVNAEKCIMRIYRDVRFSKNKDPYKTNFGLPFPGKIAGMEKTGYYLHIEPGASFVGGGYWMPTPEDLKKIRQEIDYNPKEIHKILENKEFRQLFGQLSEEDKLKNAPKEYPKDHPDIELLKLKQFVAFTPLSDKELMNESGVDTVLHAVKTLKPMIDFLARSI